MMIIARKTFRKALKFCRYKEQQLKDEKMAADYLNNNVKIFWKKIKARRVQSTVASEQIDCAWDHNTIAEVLARKFFSLNGTSPSTVLIVNYPSVTASEVKVSPDEMIAAVTKQLKNLNNFTVIYLKRFYNSCLCHNYLPQPVLDGQI